MRQNLGYFSECKSGSLVFENKIKETGKEALSKEYYALP
jgi:hypothetical protein